MDLSLPRSAVSGEGDEKGVSESKSNESVNPPKPPEKSPIDAECQHPETTIITLLGEQGHGKSMVGGLIHIMAHQADGGEYSNLPRDSRIALDQSAHKVSGSPYESSIFRCGSRTYLVDIPGNRIHEALKGAWIGNIIVTVISVSSKENSSFTLKCQTGLLLEWARQKLGLGVEYVFLITKMDSVGWDQAKFEESKAKLHNMFPNLASNSTIIPVSGVTGLNIVRKASESSWYEGQTLIEFLTRWTGKPKYEAGIPYPKEIYSKFECVILARQANHVLGKVSNGFLDLNEGVLMLPPKTSLGILRTINHTVETSKAVVDDIVDFTLAEEPGSCFGSFIVALGSSMRAESLLNGAIKVVDGSITEHSTYDVHMQVRPVKGTVMKLKRGTNVVPSLSEDEGDGEVTLKMEREVCVRYPQLSSRINSFLLVHNGKIKAIGEAYRFR